MKTLVITGVTRGLGRAMAEEFIRLGHVVLGFGRSDKDLGELRRRFGKWHEFDRVDVASDEQQAKAKSRCSSQQPRRVAPRHQRADAQHKGVWHAKASGDHFGMSIFLIAACACGLRTK